MTDRLPPLADGDLDASQRAASHEFHAQRGNPVFGPFVPLLRSPELMLGLQRVGSYCRYHNAIGLRLSEFVILLVARRYAQSVEWSIHAPIAEKAGIAGETIAAILEGRRPPAMQDDETLVYDAVAELWSSNSWSDPTYAAMQARFGERGVIDLVATVGYYTTLALVMNVAQTPAPDGFTMPVLPA